MRGHVEFLTNFSRGEVTPRLAGRYDSDLLRQSARTILNGIVTPTGGVDMRPGTKYVAQGKTAEKKIRLISFEASVDTVYVLELGHQYIRFYKDHAQIESGGNPYEVVSPWTEAQLFEIQFAQDESSMYLVHPSVSPRKLVSSGDTSWNLTEPSFTAGVGEEDFSAADHYPSCVCFFENSLVFAATNTDPQTIWKSKVGNYEDFTLGTNDDDAFQLKFAADRANRVRWLVPKTDIEFGTSGGEWVLSGGGSPITPTNFLFRRHSTYGSKNLPAIPVGSSVLFFQRAGTRLREYGYSQDKDQYISPDLTILSEHITEGGVTNVDYQQDPHQIFWCVRSDGVLIGLTIDEHNGVFAWHRHITDGTIESIAIIPGTDEDEIWISVLRDVTTKRYVEYFAPRDWGTTRSDIFYVDSGITIDGGAAESIEDVTQADPGVVTITGHSFSNDDLVKITGVTGMTELNGNVYMVKNAGADTFQLYLEDGSDTLNTSGFAAYISGGSCQKVYDTVTGLDHLEGEDVAVCVNGMNHPEVTVSSGQISLQSHYNKIHAGLPFTYQVQPHRPSQSALDPIDVRRVVVRLYKSMDFKAGPDEDSLIPQEFRTFSDSLDTAVPVKTDDWEIQAWNDGWSKGDMLFQQDYPLPLNILAVFAEIEYA